MRLDLQFLLVVVVAILLFLIWMELRHINAHLRERLPTDTEQDHDWAVEDPMGHWEAHKDDKKGKP